MTQAVSQSTDYYRRIAAQAGARVVRLDPAAQADPDYQPVKPPAARLLSDRVCRQFGIVSVAYSEGVVTIAGSDPYDRTAREVAASITGRDVRFVVAPPEDINRAAYDTFQSFPEGLSTPGVNVTGQAAAA